MEEITINQITSLGSPKVLLVGDFMLDAYVYGDADRISPEAPVPVLRVVRREYRCGGAASVAAALGALGATPVCLGLLGDDAHGRRLDEMLQEFGADTSGMVQDATRPTITKQRLVGLAQHRHQQQLMRIDDESDETVSRSVNDALLDAYRRRIDEVDVVCLQDYGKGVLSEDLSREFIAIAREAGKLTLVDPSSKADYSKYRGAGLITPNRYEASQAAGLAIKTSEDAAQAAETLRDRYELDAVVITLDRDGAFIKTADLATLAPTRAKNVYDVTGAGDVVIATLAVGSASGWDALASTQLANLAAGIAVGKFGTTTVSIDEIIHERHMQTVGTAGKVLTLDALQRVLNWHRGHGESIVFTNGCFDVLHEGHTSCLNFSKQQGDILVLGLNSDASVRALKGPGRPINNEDDRAKVLASLESVDYVVVFDDPSVQGLIEEVRPDILVKGGDYKGAGPSAVVGREFVESYGGRVVLAPMAEGLSTTSTIEKIRTTTKKAS